MGMAARPLLLALLLAFAFPARAGAAEAATLLTVDEITCADGSMVRGTILMRGPRGVILALPEGSESLERFVPAAEVVKIERSQSATPAPPATGEASAPAPAASPPAPVVRYGVEPVEGQLTLVEAAEPKAGEEGESAAPSRPRPTARRAEIENENQSRRAPFGIIRSDREAAKSKKKAAQAEEDKLLNLFGGAKDKDE